MKLTSIKQCEASKYMHFRILISICKICKKDNTKAKDLQRFYLCTECKPVYSYTHDTEQ